MKYYLVMGITVYDGLEFTTTFSHKSKLEPDKNELSKIIKEYYIHKDTEEEIEDINYREISKASYDILHECGI